mmetsp:Transcript_29478/g.70056  ORF Transcript_29478/g.70056 Transcript_29478/m.70056 type:complete len:205 (-) Transcript_29478:386-1000(-)
MERDRRRDNAASDSCSADAASRFEAASSLDRFSTSACLDKREDCAFSRDRVRPSAICAWLAASFMTSSLSFRDDLALASKSIMIELRRDSLASDPSCSFFLTSSDSSNDDFSSNNLLLFPMHAARDFPNDAIFESFSTSDRLASRSSAERIAACSLRSRFSSTNSFDCRSRHVWLVMLRSGKRLCEDEEEMAQDRRSRSTLFSF